MKGLTLFVLPVEDDKEHKEEDFLFSFVDKVVFLDKRDLSEVAVDTEWYGYLFSNETFSRSLIDYLPVYLEDKEHEFYVLFTKIESTGKMFHSPRIFRKGVKLEKLLPKELGLKYTRVLDGWVKVYD